MAEERVIIGLTGSFGSGCSTVSSILASLGFQIISLSKFLKDEALRRDPKFNDILRKEKRKMLQDIGNEFCLKDPGILIKKAFEIADKGKDMVIESLKNPGEIQELKKEHRSYVIALDASFVTRKERIIDKEYDGDNKQFVKDDRREKDEGIPHGQRLQECVDLADILIDNDEDNKTPQEKDEFARDLQERFIKLLKKPGQRKPTDMEMWMNNAYSVSLQSECLKRQVGAIIVKDGYAVAAGKNHVAPDEESCKKVYKDTCYRDGLRKKIKYCPVCGKDLDKDFDCKDAECAYNENNLVKLLDKCRSLHAEENAILQAASLGGVSLKNGIIYTTTFPCKLCANKIISVGIKEVVYVEAYPDQDSVDFFKRHSKQVTITKFEGVKTSSFYNLFKAENS